ncbi:MAG: S28 family serine protease [Bacteroidota bacterium]
MRFNLPSFCLILIIAISFTITSCNNSDDSPANNGDILDRLNALAGVSAIELITVDHFNRLFEITVEQPVDHNQPNGAVFTQKIYLGHIDENLPVAFETEGYARSSHKTRELSGLLNINQLTVEHRYFGESVPFPKDWQYLTIWQAAQDHHRIVELFKTIYKANWVSSGASKGGNAAIFHRRFFPDDVDATVAYVTPLLFEEEDQRFLEFYQTAGNEMCREKMKAYQRNMLMKIDSFPPLFETYINDVNEFYSTDIKFSLPFESIVYFAIMEDYAFEFWSSETENCGDIPNENASVQELFNHFVAVFDIFLFFSDYGVEFWTPWLYQAKTEIGTYAYDADHLQDLTMNIAPPVTFNIPTEFDPSVMADIDNWLQTESSRLILIYGQEDPWTVAAIDHPGFDDVIKTTNSITKHSTRIADLESSSRTLILEHLNMWLGL